MKNDAEELVEIIDGQRHFDGKRLLPSQMVWRCTVIGCSSPPKPQRRGQYKDKLLCNACANRVKSQDPAILERRGKAISKSIKALGDKWSVTATQNMAIQDTRDKISASMKEYIAENQEIALKVRKETAFKNNEASGFGTSEFAAKIWAESTIEERKTRTQKTIAGGLAVGRKEHIEILHARFPNLKLLEFGRPDNTYECEKGHVFIMRGNNILKRGNCPICSPRSRLQTNWYEWFKTLCPDALPDKKVLYLDDTKNGNKALEVDMWSPERNLGLEVHGLYYHTQEWVGSSHFKKAKLADKHSLRLLQFFEDELNDSPEIVKSIVKSKLGLCDRRLYARNCELKAISDDELRIFLIDNHLQGYCRSFIKMGLFFKDELVSVMSIRKVYKKDNIAEIARFSSKTNTMIVGGFSRLLKAVLTQLKESGFVKLLTYADRRYSQGAIYKVNGFTFSHLTVPDLFWYKKSQRYPRQISWGKSKKQMNEEGYEMLLGAGHSLWTMKIM
jgi:hypothetical protein